MKYPLFYPNIYLNETLKELRDTLSGRWIGQAHKVEEFEKQFAKKYGYKYVLFLNSCTAALELSYHLLDLKKGDEVIVPVLDCTAGQTALLRRGVKIVFADIDYDFTISVDSVRKKITKKTKAIIAVNLGGIEVNEDIFDLGLPVITDSAQHLGKTKGDYICYSFQAIKHITTADGGMLVLNNEKDYVRAKKLRWFGIDRDLKAKNNWQAWERRQMTFDIEEAGYKFQPTDVDACLGLVGLRHADEVVKYRQELVSEYRKHLPGINIVAGGSCWLMGIMVENRDEVAAHLKKFGIETNLAHLRNDIFKVFGGKRLPLHNMNEFEDKYLYLPLNLKITKKDVGFICDKILKITG
jgi:perosamine synthetase